jgi:hypothetical protein
LTGLFTQIPAGDLDIPVIAQLVATQLALGDPLEPDSHFSGVGRSVSKRWKTRRGTRTTPEYSPLSMPNSTAFSASFHRASSAKTKDIVISSAEAVCS